MARRRKAEQKNAVPQGVWAMGVRGGGGGTRRAHSMVATRGRGLMEIDGVLVIVARELGDGAEQLVTDVGKGLGVDVIDCSTVAALEEADCVTALKRELTLIEKVMWRKLKKQALEVAGLEAREAAKRYTGVEEAQEGGDSRSATKEKPKVNFATVEDAMERKVGWAYGTKLLPPQEQLQALYDEMVEGVYPIGEKANVNYMVRPVRIGEKRKQETEAQVGSAEDVRDAIARKLRGCVAVSAQIAVAKDTDVEMTDAAVHEVCNALDAVLDGADLEWTSGLIEEFEERAYKKSRAAGVKLSAAVIGATVNLPQCEAAVRARGKAIVASHGGATAKKKGPGSPGWVEPLVGGNPKSKRPCNRWPNCHGKCPYNHELARKRREKKEKGGGPGAESSP